MRSISRVYADPLDIIWTHAAGRMGMRIVRSAEVNASWDGNGVLTIGTPETLDPDDSLAQMVLHETCHALIEGPESLTKPDWGLHSFDPSKKIHEHACLRLQAALADRVGMRDFFAATTMFRSYYDNIPDAPLVDDGDPAVAMAVAAWHTACHGPWSEALDDALHATAGIAELLRGATDGDSLWHAAGSA
jgi:hypothetical protein